MITCGLPNEGGMGGLIAGDPEAFNPFGRELVLELLIDLEVQGDISSMNRLFW